LPNVLSMAKMRSRKKPRLIRHWLTCLLLLFGCAKDPGTAERVEVARVGSIDSIQFPILIEGGTKIVYQIGHMTPDKGLKLFLDTVEYSPGNNVLSDSLKLTSLFPLLLSVSEKDSAACLVIESQPGYSEEIVFGLIDTDGRLRINYRSEDIYFRPMEKLVFDIGGWSSTFRSDSLEIHISSKLKDTPFGDYLAGAGKLRLTRGSRLLEEKNIFLLRSKNQLMARH
jgi:hypothetical protein